jgi:hypothetical protein
MSKLHSSPPAPEPTPAELARQEFRLLAETLAGEVREAAAAAGLAVAERRRRLNLLLYAVPLEVATVLIATLLDIGARGPFDPELNTLAADGAHRQLAAVGSAWRMAMLADATESTEMLDARIRKDVQRAHAADTAWPPGTPPVDDLADAASCELTGDASPRWPALDPDHIAPAGPGRAGGPVQPPPMVDPALPASAADVYREIAAGVEEGLPLPASVAVRADLPMLIVDMHFDSDPVAVDRWAARLGLGQPGLADRLITTDRTWRTYATTEGGMPPEWRGWRVKAWCPVDEPSSGGHAADDDADGGVAE